MHESIRDLKIKSLEKTKGLTLFSRSHIAELTNIQIFYLENRELETTDPIEIRAGFNLTPDMEYSEMVKGLKGLTDKNA